MTKQEYIEILQNHKVDEILTKESDWEVLYKLSPIRKNILAWYDFEDGESVLEIGCGSGSITEVFCEKGMQIDAIEKNEEELEICEARVEQYKKPIKYYASLSAVKDKQYDYVSLIGTLENAKTYIDSADAVQDLLGYAKDRLKSGGKLFVAFDNKYAIRSLAGMPDFNTGKLFDTIQGFVEKEKQAFSRMEIELKIKKAGFNDISYYYPYPDYMLPLQIFSDEYLPKEDDITESAASYRWPRMQLFDEVLAYDAICKDGLYPQFANSYLMICE